MEEKLYIQSNDGLKLSGILLKPQLPTTTCIILCHGITADKDEGGIFTALAKTLCEKGYAVFRFDFRGHGESEGNSVDITITGEIHDVNSVVKFMQEKGYRQFGILGASFAGGAVSYYTAAHQDTIKALVLWNALLDYEKRIHPNTEWGKKFWGKSAFDRVGKFGYTEIGSKKYKIGKPLLEDMERLTPWKELQTVSTPVLFVHGDKDTYVAYADSVRISKMVSNARLATITGGQHGFHDRKVDFDLAIKVTLEFFENQL